MTTRTYISTLGSTIEAKEAERVLLEQSTQEFLNQGGEITQLGDRIIPFATPMSAHNKKLYDINKKKRDDLVEDVVKLLTQGMSPSSIQKRLGIHYKSYNTLIKENNLQGFPEK